jgi:DNA (cytosine-5)-methyltransferase 1
MLNSPIRFIDLFAGLGGMRLGLEQACASLDMATECVLTSEIKPHAVRAYQDNFPDTLVDGDISQIDAKDIPDFDVLLAGFPCQPFSSAGNRAGFMDTRGTLFFEIERILEAKRPYAFLLENVEGLVTHDRAHRSDAVGQTLNTILTRLTDLGYQVTWELLDGQDFGVPQSRKRVYIVGTLDESISLGKFPKSKKTIKSILQKKQPLLDTEFTKRLLSHFDVGELQGKSIKDKRGGDNNIHSWDIEIKGKTTLEQRSLLRQLLKQRRRKHWAGKKGMQWMDGMPLTLKEIETFYQSDTLFGIHDLKSMLDDLVEKGYLKFEHPKDLVQVIDEQGNVTKGRQYAKHLPKGYNIVVGKLSFEISKILDANDVSPTLVATDVTRLAVVDGKGLRRLTVREGLRLFGFPETYDLDLAYTKAFDLLGNTVVVPAIEAIAKQILSEPEMITEPDQYVQHSLF